MKPAVSCSNCALYQTAQVLGLETLDCSHINEVVIRDHAVEKDETLYKEGDDFRYLYLIHSGSCVSLGTLASGQKQIMSYYLPGELAGIESIGHEKYNHTTLVLEQGSVCRLDFLALPDELSADKLIQVQDYLLKAAATHANQLQWARSLTSLQAAEQRVAAFLLNLSSRFEARAIPASSFRLPMSRDAIGDYLGLASETVIRTLKKLQAKQLVSIKAKQINLLDKKGLHKLAAFTVDQ